MRRIVLMAALALLPAACRDSSQEATDRAVRADRAIAQVGQLRLRVADLEAEVADLGGQLETLDPRGADDGDDEPAVSQARYGATSSPARAVSIRARVRSRPKMAAKEPKRGPWLCPNSTS